MRSTTTLTQRYVLIQPRGASTMAITADFGDLSPLEIALAALDELRSAQALLQDRVLHLADKAGEGRRARKARRDLEAALDHIAASEQALSRLAMSAAEPRA